MVPAIFRKPSPILKSCSSHFNKGFLCLRELPVTPFVAQYLLVAFSLNTLHLQEEIMSVFLEERDFSSKVNVEMDSKSYAICPIETTNNQHGLKAVET